MARVNKKTRIKGVPFKVALQEKDACGGQFPTNVRMASDNRTGIFKTRYDDNCTILFTDRDSTFLDAVDSYFRFNSGSITSSFNQVTQRTFPAGSASYGIRPVYLSNNRDLSADEHQMEYSSIRPPSFVHFDSSVPFAGPVDDPNLTSVCFFPADFTRVSGSSAIWNPGTVNAVSGPGLTDNPFSVSVWVNQVGASAVQTILSVGDDSATHAPLGITTGSNFQLELRSAGLVLVKLVGSGNNGIGRSWSGTGAGSGWSHIVATYDGSRTFDGFKLYVDGVDQGAGTGAFQGTLGAYGGMSASLDDHKIFMGCLGSHDTLTTFDGFIDELVIFNRVISGGEAGAIFNYTRTLTQLSGGVDPLGSVMYHGITVPQGWQFFTQQTEQTTSLNGPGKVIKGVSDTFVKFDEKNQNVIETRSFIQGQQFVTVATVTTGLRQDFSPFRDHSNPAVDGKSTGDSFYTTGSKVQEAGEGFTGPLWSKTKIEVPLNISGSAQMPTYVRAGRDTSGQLFNAFWDFNYPMSYFDFQNNTWTGVGIGVAYSQLTTSVDLGKGPYDNPYKDYNMLGFAPSPVMISPESATGTWNNIISGVFEWQASAGTPFSNYGFPFHPKFHATASNLLRMNQFISRPFLLEKVFIEVSATFTWNPETYTTASFRGNTGNTITSLTESLVPACINNIFLLNQRRPAKFTNTQRVEFLAFDPDDPLDDSLINVSVPVQYNLSNPFEKVLVDSSRDLIAYGGITSFATNMPPTESFRGGSTSLFTSITPEIGNPTELLTREVNFFSTGAVHDNLSALSWTGVVQMEMQARSPIRIDRDNENADNVFSIHAEAFNSSIITYADLKFSEGGRNGLGLTQPSGKDRRSPAASLQPTAKFDNLFSLGKENVLVPFQSHTIPNGYLIEPEDELIVGWQQPIPMFIYPTGSGDPNSKNVIDQTTITSITFHEHPESRMILYGSELREDQEFHDTLNQLLTSEAVHEIIE